MFHSIFGHLSQCDQLKCEIFFFFSLYPPELVLAAACDHCVYLFSVQVSEESNPIFSITPFRQMKTLFFSRLKLSSSLSLSLSSIPLTILVVIISVYQYLPFTWGPQTGHGFPDMMSQVLSKGK